MTKVQIKNVVRSQLPDFIQGNDDYENFKLFLEAYYQFLDQNETRTIEAIRDIDQSLDDFINQFKNEFDTRIEYTGNKALLLRHIKDLYSSKGSETSYKLLFRLLYNKNVDLIYPGDFVLKPSDGKWVQDTTFFATVTSGNALSMVGTEIDLNTADKTIKLFVERVKHITANTYQLFINKNYFGTISVGDIITSGDVVGTVLPTTLKLVVEQKGVGFKVGQLFEIITGTGSGTKIKVTKVDAAGGILGAKIIQFGLGYESEFQYNLNNAVTLITDTADVEGYVITAQDYTSGFVDSGSINKQSYWVSDYGDGTYTGEIMASFYSDSNITGEASSCVIRFFIGAIAKYPGYFSTNDGFISDAMYIQDSKYYQSYSYVIRIDEQLFSYKDAVKKYIHPAGFALFGDYTINNKFNFSLSHSSEIETFTVSAYTYVSTYVDDGYVTEDYVY